MNPKGTPDFGKIALDVYVEGIVHQLQDPGSKKMCEVFPSIIDRHCT